MYNQFTKKNKELVYKRNMIEMEAKAFISQMNPHFIYNSLSAAQYFIMSNENEKAFNYLSDFSLLLRQMFENAKNQSIKLIDEIGFLKRYIELEKLRFNNSVIYTLAFEGGEEVSNNKIPPMMIQPIVENAIRHGLAPKKDNAELNISFCFENHLVICKIEDNGIGLKNGAQTFLQTENSALKIIRERLSIINEATNRSGYLNVVDKNEHGDTGLLVEVSLPVFTD